MLTAMRLINRKSNVPGIAFNMRAGAKSQVDCPKFLSRMGVDHAKEVGWNSMNGMQSELREPDPEVVVATLFEVNAVARVLHNSDS